MDAIANRIAVADKSSMLYWHPKIKDLDIPQPKNEILEMQVGMDEWFKWLDGKAGEYKDA